MRRTWQGKRLLEQEAVEDDPGCEHYKAGEEEEAEEEAVVADAEGEGAGVGNESDHARAQRVLGGRGGL